LWSVRFIVVPPCAEASLHAGEPTRAGAAIGRKVLRKDEPRRTRLFGAEFIESGKYGDKLLALTGIRLDLFQSINHFGVFRPEFIDQRIGLFAERFDRLAIVLLVSLLHLIVGLIQIAIDLCFRFIAGDDLDDFLNILGIILVLTTPAVTCPSTL
jgi:hypothetical protein